MIILGIFLVLTIVEFGFLWFQWDKVSTVVEVAEFVGDNVNLHEKQDAFMATIRKIVKKFKKLLWIPAGLLLFVNFLVALIVGGIATLIIALF